MTPYYYKKHFKILFFLFGIIFPLCSVAQIQVNSVNATPATCPNNGKITVNATTTTPPLLYSIISGPVTQPVQTNNILSSLLPGNYTIKLADGGGHETTVTASITGTYQNPDFTIADTTPYCVGQSNGKLVGQAIPGRGLAPFSWQLVAPSPVITGWQNNGTFQNLPAGNYSMRISDACGSFSTNAFVLKNPDTKFSFWGSPVGQAGNYAAQKVGCDSMRITYWLDIQNPRMPLNFKYITSNGIFIPTSGTTIDSNSLHSTGQVMVSQVIPGVDYGDMVSARIFNTCGDSAFSLSTVLHPFVFYPKYSFNDCGSTANVVFTNTPTYDYHTSIIPNATYSLTQIPSNVVVASGTITVGQNNGYIPITPTVVSGQTYIFKITDRCGETFQGNFTVPGLAPPVIIHQDIVSGACIDSVVGTYRVLTAGFGTNARLIVLSGPPTLGSTQPGFEYQDTYVYPDTVRMVNGESFMMNNLAIGTYHYKIIDDCGNEILGSITITPQQVTSLKKVTDYKKGCPNRNKIYYSMVNGGNVIVRNIGTNVVLADRDFIPYTDNYQASVHNKDSVLNLPDGSYEITYQYLQLIGALENGTALNESQKDCWKIVDTVVIAPYQFPAMTTFNSIMCNNAIHIELIPDSTKGVAPYQYEIIAGPQLFPAQNGNVFTVTTAGTYTARIYDACGNASTKQITVDTISFDPIEVHATCFNTSMYFPSSLYFVYEWLMPNGQVHVGDSLILNPVTPADTGTYHISKIININGCIDTLKTSYHVTLHNLRVQTIPFCVGTDVHVGPNTYNIPGIYHDTLTSSIGCDSIVITTLAVLPQHSDTTQMVICPGDSLEISGVYQSIPGFYLDSVQNTFGCYDLLVTHLAINPIADTLHVSICPQGSYQFGGTSYGNSGYYSDTLVSAQGCDSISVLHLTLQPYIQHTITHTMCPNWSFNFGGHVLTVAGVYRDTLQTAHCDSIVTLNLVVLPYKYRTTNQVICQGNYVTIGGHNYSVSGTYTDTLLMATCDSIITLNLTVLPYKYNAITQNICQGDSYTIGGHVYTLPGVYSDTLSTSGCDSIVTLTLNVLPLKYHDIYEIICQGDDYAFGGMHYTHTGVYSNTFPTATCDSIVTLHLTVIPEPNVQIISTAYETGNGVVVLLNALSNSHPLNYQWTSSAVLNAYNIKNPTTNIANPTWVYVTVTDTNGCTATDGYLVQLPVTSTLYIPNSFTPNGDESNQVFRVYGTNIAEFKIMIFDRWGEIIFESIDIHAGWDGTYKGKIVQDGTYVYKVLAVGMDSVIYDKTGHVTVLK